MNGVAFGPDGTRIATASDDFSARVLDAATGAELARMGHEGAVNGVAFSPDCTRVATASDDCSARVFDATTGAQLARLDHEAAVNAVAFSPDGMRIATGNDDFSARVFDAATGAQLARLDHEAAVNAVAFGPDGTRVATGSDDFSARVFDAATGAEVLRLPHDGTVHSVAFSPDGTEVATGSAIDNVTRLLHPAWGLHPAWIFDCDTGIQRCRLDHDEAVNGVAFSPDGTRLATASTDHSVRLFEINPGLLVSRAIDVMTRPLNAVELRRYSLPQKCRHIDQWELRQQERVSELRRSIQ